MKINTYMGERDINEVFEELPEEVLKQIKEYASIDEVLQIIEKYEKPIQIVQKYIELKNELKDTTSDLMKTVFKVVEDFWKIKEKYTYNDIEAMKNVKLNRYYIKDEFLKSSKGYERNLYERKVLT